MQVQRSSQRLAIESVSKSSRISAHTEWRSKDPTSRNASPKRSTLMRCLTWSATAPSLIPSGCSAGVVAPASLAGWVVSPRSLTSTPLLQMASGVGLTFFGSFVPQFSLSDVPLQTIAEKVAAGRLRSKPSRVFRFEDIREAHRVMEANEANGKLVVVSEKTCQGYAHEEWWLSQRQHQSV